MTCGPRAHGSVDPGQRGLEGTAGLVWAETISGPGREQAFGPWGTSAGGRPERQGQRRGLAGKLAAGRGGSPPAARVGRRGPTRYGATGGGTGRARRRPERRRETAGGGGGAGVWRSARGRGFWQGFLGRGGARARGEDVRGLGRTGAATAEAGGVWRGRRPRGARRGFDWSSEKRKLKGRGGRAGRGGAHRGSWRERTAARSSNRGERRRQTGRWAAHVGKLGERGSDQIEAMGR
jgi:hypothetical protein